MHMHMLNEILDILADIQCLGLQIQHSTMHIHIIAFLCISSSSRPCGITIPALQRHQQQWQSPNSHGQKKHEIDGLHP